jgi:hypothetical protein
LNMFEVRGFFLFDPWVPLHQHGCLIKYKVDND